MASAISGELLSSWKEIANYLNCGIRTVQRWESQFGLPVRRLGTKHRSGVMAMRAEVDSWLKTHSLQNQVVTSVAGALVADEGTIRFLQTEIESGLTFAELASTAQPHDTQKIDRNLRNALKAYHTAVKFRRRYLPDAATAFGLDAGLKQLAQVLHARGEPKIEGAAVYPPEETVADS